MSMWKKRECGGIYWKDFWTDELSCVDVISGHDSGRISDKYNRTGGGERYFDFGDHKHPGFLGEQA